MCGTAAPAHATYWTLLTSGDLMACSPLGAGMGTVHSEGRRCLGQEEGPSAGPLGAVFASLRVARSWMWGRTGSQAAGFARGFQTTLPATSSFGMLF